MYTVKNTSNARQAFNVAGGDTKILAPGEEDTFDLADPDSAQNQGREIAGVCSFKKADAAEKRAAKRKAKAEDDEQADTSTGPASEAPVDP